ncbi:tetratricopeptide repeat protein [Agromyces sp. SYSU T00266]|uniref:tetratricopeptide repeat protein n=1 Tax=Agromyces zhanjiangensis TaxID=3158562 RepID=UPI00339181D4
MVRSAPEDPGIANRLIDDPSTDQIFAEIIRANFARESGAIEYEAIRLETWEGRSWAATVRRSNPALKEHAGSPSEGASGDVGSPNGPVSEAELDEAFQTIAEIDPNEASELVSALLQRSLTARQFMNLLELLQRLPEKDRLAMALKHRAVDAGNAGVLPRSAVAIDHLGFPNEAEALFRRAVELDPDNYLYAWSLGGFLVRRDGDTSEAETYLRRAYQLAPDNLELAWFVAAFLESDQGELDEAERIYRTLLERDPENSETLRRYAVFQELYREDRAKARELFSTAIGVSDVDPTTKARAAIFFAEEGELDDAERLFEEALAQDSTDARTIRQYAAFQDESRKNSERAEELYTAATQLPEVDSYTLVLAARFFERQNRRDEVDDLFARAMSLDPAELMPVWNYAVVLDHRGDSPDQAEFYYRRVIELDPDEAQHWWMLGAFLQINAPQDSPAIELFREAHAREPHNALFAWSLANSIERQSPGDPEIETLLRQALASEPESARYSWTLADYLEDYAPTGDEAEALFRRAVELDPDNYLYAWSLGGFLVRRDGDTSEAETYLRRAYQLAPDNLELAWFVAAFLESDQGELDEAERIYRTLLERDPENSETLRRYAVFQELYREDRAKARELFSTAIGVSDVDPTTKARAAIFFAEEGELDDAERLFEEALAQDSTDARTIRQYAAFQDESRKNSERAEELYTAATQLPEVDSYTLVLAARFFERQNRLGLAISLLSQHPKLGSDAFVTMQHARLMRRSGNLETATSIVSTALDSHGLDVVWLELAGYVFLESPADISLASSLWERAAELSPSDINLAVNLAQLLLVQERVAEAAPRILRALEDETLPAPLRLEASIYAVAHDLEFASEGLAVAESLLARGERTPGWNFEPTLSWVQRERPAVLQQVRELVRRAQSE